MEYTLDNSHSVYIQMNVSGVVDKSGLLSAMSELVMHPDFTDKHSLWDFTQATMGLSISDFGEIAGVLGLYKSQKKNFANKSALLIPNLMELSMAKMFVSISKLLPFKYKVFKTREKALVFLVNDQSSIT